MLIRRGPAAPMLEGPLGNKESHRGVNWFTLLSKNRSTRQTVGNPYLFWIYLGPINSPLWKEGLYTPLTVNRSRFPYEFALKTPCFMRKSTFFKGIWSFWWSSCASVLDLLFALSREAEKRRIIGSCVKEKRGTTKKQQLFDIVGDLWAMLMIIL